MRFQTMRRACALLPALVLALASVAGAQAIPVRSSLGLLPAGTAGTISTAGVDCAVETACISFNVDDIQAFSIRVNVGSSGTLVPEVSLDATAANDGTWDPAPNGTASITVDGLYGYSNTGYRRFRLRASAITGSTTVLPARGFPAGGEISGDVMIDTTGLATSAKQDTTITALSTLFTQVTGALMKDDTAAIKIAAEELAAATNNGAVDVNIKLADGQPLTPESTEDFNTGGTNTPVALVGVAIPSGSGPVAVQGDATNKNLYVTVRNGSTSMPAMAAVGSAGFQKITDGTNTMPTMDAVGRRGFVGVTDGTNSMPTMDAVGRRGFFTHTDGTNSMPTGDTVGRAIFHKVTDGTDTFGIDANGLGYFASGFSADSTIGGSECVIVSAASTNATNCKATPGNFYGLELTNSTTTAYYVRLYNTSGTPTCSSATGFVRSIAVPPAAASGQIGGIVRVAALPINYSAGIGYCITAGAASTDNNNAAVGILGSLFYK